MLKRPFMLNEKKQQQKLTLIVRQSVLTEMPDSTTIPDLFPPSKFFRANRKFATKFLPTNVEAYTTQRHLVT